MLIDFCALKDRRAIAGSRPESRTVDSYSRRAARVSYGVSHTRTHLLMLAPHSLIRNSNLRSQLEGKQAEVVSLGVSITEINQTCVYLFGHGLCGRFWDLGTVFNLSGIC